MKYALEYKSALPDVALYELFDRLADAGRLELTFHDGEIRTHHQFRDMVRREDLHFWALLGDAAPLGMLWITDARHGAVNTHFAMLGTAHPIADVRGARFIVASVLRLRDEAGRYLVDVMHGTTPVRNGAACRWIQKVGFVAAGELPGAVWMADAQRLEPALISYATRKTAPAAWAGMENEE